MFLGGLKGFGFCVRRKGTSSQVMEAKRNGPGEEKKIFGPSATKRGLARQQRGKQPAGDNEAAGTWKFA